MNNVFHHQHVHCPVCQSPAQFASAATHVLVCSVCNSLIKRKVGDKALTVLSTKAKKMFANAAVSIGAVGEVNSKKFRVIGGLHAYFQRYYSNRWTVLFNDGQVGLITETMGFWALHQVQDYSQWSALPTLANVEVGKELIPFGNGEQVFVADKAKCDDILIDGEVVWADEDGVFTSYELATTSGQRYEVLELKKGLFEVYAVTYLPYQSFAFEPAAPALPTPQKMNCGNCGKPIEVMLPRLSVHLCCANCRGWNAVTPSGLQFRDKCFSLHGNSQIVPGKTGNFKLVPYVVIGACEKYEAGNKQAKWREYTLYHQQHGYAWLSEYNGHWIWLTEQKLGMLWPAFADELLIDKQMMDLYNSYGFQLISAIGEFTMPLSGGGIMAREYIAPPQMYIAEIDDNKELTWFKGEYISAEEVAEAFGLPLTDMPLSAGVGALQVQRWSASPAFVRNLALIALVCFFAVQIYFSASAKQEIVFTKDFFLEDTLPPGGLVTSSFELKPASSNLEFIITSPVNNNWFEAAMVMVNDKTGQEYSFEKGVEYYYGTDGGESWSEGSQTNSLLLQAIPAGRYHLNIFPSFGNGQAIRLFSIRAVNDVPMWRNFMIVVVLMLIYPAIVWWRATSFEHKRWNDSDHSP
jgi:hypothetical protein